MGGVITSILTDAKIRSSSSVDAALVSQDKAFTPWN